MSTLVTIELTTQEHVYTRTIYTDYNPSNAELSFYYKDLCGFSDATIAVKHYVVPSEFNARLLTFGEPVPTRFPNYDIITEPSNTEHRKKYHAYIQQLTDMEKSRIALKVSAASVDSNNQPEVATAESVRGVAGRYRLKQADWVKDLLESLESEEVPVGDELVPAVDDGVVSHAWVLTPVVESVRSKKGSRLVLDRELGQHWERLLGTPIFPDFVVTRRVGTHSWTFRHPSSETLVKALVDYYVAAQDVEIVCGLSDWIHSADKDLGSLMHACKRVKVSERVMSRGTNPNSIFNILAAIEAQCLGVKSEYPNVVLASMAVFRKYVNYVAQALNIPRDQYMGMDMVNQILRRWERTEMGFRGDSDPIISAWTKTWQMLMRINPCAERLTLFLTTLDAWNPLEGGTLMTIGTRNEIARQWIDVYVENELIIDRKGFENSILLYSETARWCLQFLPKESFTTCLRVERTSSEYTRLGFKKTRPSGQIVMRGLRFRNRPTGLPADTETVAGEDISDEVSEKSAGDKELKPATKAKLTKAAIDAKKTVVIKSETPINELIMNLGSL